MIESRVPSSRLGRLWEYGGLAASMAFGVVGESIRRSSGQNDAKGSLLLSPGNIERLVNKLSKMRGAALKLGQMMSFQGLPQFITAGGYCVLIQAPRFQDVALNYPGSVAARSRQGKLHAALSKGQSHVGQSGPRMESPFRIV
jgi:hypothetical protein